MSTPLATLPMYWRPELAGHFDRFWILLRDALRSHGITAPDGLATSSDLKTDWLNPTLVVSQTCGMPFRLFLSGHVRLVATPDYGLEACPQGYYRSAIVVRADDPRLGLADFAEARFALNDVHSQSGFAAPLNHAKAQGVTFGNRVMSGSHTNSARMVAENKADIAAIDAVSWIMIQRYDRFAKKLRVLEWTIPPTPGLPFITSRYHDAKVIRTALSEAIRQLDERDRSALGLKGLIDIPVKAYLTIPNPS